MARMIPAPQGCVTKVSFIDLGENIKAVVHCDGSTLAFADMNGKRYKDLYNDREPFDRRSHGFLFDKEELTRAGQFCVSFICRKDAGVLHEPGSVAWANVSFDPALAVPYRQAVASTDRGLALKSSTCETVCQGVEYSVEHYALPTGEPVVAYVLKYDPGVAQLCTGTPNGTYDYRNQQQTVMEEALYAQKQGKQVIAAFNADFFDMFGDCAPSGLCVKDGQIVANPDSDRFFLGITKDGRHIIDNLAGQPWLLEDLEHAVGGRELLLRDGEIWDVAVGESFGYTPHPRTVAGLCGDGSVVIAVVDGRRPWHSNGATLYDAAVLLRRHGAVRGINLDGGGSSTFIVENKKGRLEMLNHPADLHRPYEDLIRDVFDSILIVKKS